MKIENGITSHFLSTDNLDMLNKSFNLSHPGIKATISVNLNWREDDVEDDEADLALTPSTEPPAKTPYLRYVLSYKHALSPQEKVYIIAEQCDGQIDVHKGIQSVLDIYLKQTRTCEHHFVRPKDAYGKEFPDGRAVCEHCELELKAILPKAAGHVISMSCDKDVVAQHDWGNAYIQGGGSGLVLSKKGNYTTAFMEAFPSIHGFGTFLRGEGENILAAEKACWDSYQRKLNCKGHEWSREVHGQHRADGYAQCIHCGLCTSDALQPETLCRVCKAPTTNTIDDEFLCLTHYYELPEDDRAAAYVRMMTDHRDSDSGKQQYDFDYRFIARMQDYAFSQLGAKQYSVIESTLRRVLGFAKLNFYALMLQSHPLKSDQPFGDSEHAKMTECHALMKQNWPVILEYLNGAIANRQTPSGEAQKLRGVHVADVIPSQYLPQKEEPA